MLRLYLPVELTPGADIGLPAALAHRLREVQRAAPGQQIIVFNGRGGEYRVTLTEISRTTATVRIGDFSPITRESTLEITLAQGIARGERMDYTIQKAIELGVHKIVPIAMSRSQVKLDEARAERRLSHWQGIVVSACEQCGRTVVPNVTPVLSLDEFIAIDHADTRLTLAPRATHGLRALITAPSSLGPRVSLVIGPEGGLSPHEEQRLKTAGYVALRLGPRILRTETAALVALSALQTLVGDLLTEPAPNFG